MDTYYKLKQMLMNTENLSLTFKHREQEVHIRVLLRWIILQQQDMLNVTVRDLENTNMNKQWKKQFFWKVILICVSCSSSRLVDLAVKYMDWGTPCFPVLSLKNQPLP